uniref:Uncharacterized protein n=1 Tax=Cacopsylla melanoneura TaxID=428564 RepID=A0A8D9F687_9HEMI
MVTIITESDSLLSILGSNPMFKKKKYLWKIPLSRLPIVFFYYFNCLCFKFVLLYLCQFQLFLLILFSRKRHVSERDVVFFLFVLYFYFRLRNILFCLSFECT